MTEEDYSAASSSGTRPDLPTQDVDAPDPALEKLILGLSDALGNAPIPPHLRHLAQRLERALADRLGTDGGDPSN
ncbi:hypothetical protein [Halodurantibacterium flavum]|uniref:Anti-sigma factor NepR domain-containing protein n=1 Tax=Halodurantibacterium flavum TaxID=1382802 RepID=A0ABW4S6N4_9RHOB